MVEPIGGAVAPDPAGGAAGAPLGGPEFTEHGFITQQLFDARIKANEIVGEHLKQVITIASGTLALTVSFLKDVVGSSGAKSAGPWLLPTSWVALGISILSAVVCMATLVNNLDVPDLTIGKTKRWIKAFAAGTKKYVVGLEWAALIAFATGMLALAVFGAVNYRLFLEGKTREGNDKAAQAAKDMNHFAIVPDPDYIGPRGKKHSHTFLLDQKSGSVWDVHCRPDGAVEFRRLSVDGISDRSAP